MAKTNSGLLEFKDDQKVLIALDDATSEVKKAVIIDADGTETDIAGGGGGVTVEALSVTENGTYSEEGKAYSPVTVNVAGGSSDLTWILPEQTVTLVDQPVEVTGLRLDLIPQNTDVVPIKLIYELAGNLNATYIALRYLNGAFSDNEGTVEIFPQNNSYYFVYTDGEEIHAGEFTISIAVF